MTPWQPRLPRAGSWFDHHAEREPARLRRLRGAVRALKGACERRSVDGIAELLSRGAELLVDSGGSVPEPLREVHGPLPIGAALVGLLSLFRDAAFEEADVNGMPGLALVSEGVVVGVISIEMRRRAISDVWIVVNPDKLRHWNR